MDNVVAAAIVPIRLLQNKFLFLTLNFEKVQVSLE
jgi:hypothetical protein